VSHLLFDTVNIFIRSGEDMVFPQKLYRYLKNVIDGFWVYSAYAMEAFKKVFRSQ